MVGIDGKLHDLEAGYEELHHKLAIDREALIMMCHQYAYASTIPDECGPIIGGLSQPIQYQWTWPTANCPGQPALPPFDHPLPHYEKNQKSSAPKVQPQPQPVHYDQGHPDIHYDQGHPDPLYDNHGHPDVHY